MMLFFNENIPDLVPTLLNLRARAKPFNLNYLLSDLILKEVSCSSWWKTVDPSKAYLPDKTVDLIWSLQTAVTSNASIERVFNSFGLAYSKLRNRLGVEKAGKLVFLYKILNRDVDFWDSDS